MPFTIRPFCRFPVQCVGNFSVSGVRRKLNMIGLVLALLLLTGLLVQET